MTPHPRPRARRLSTEAIAASIARRYGLGPVDYVAGREAHEKAIGTTVNARGETLGEKAKLCTFQRLVGALVTSAWNAGWFCSDKVTDARSHSRLWNDGRDEESEGVWGFESKAQRARRFVAQMGLRPVPSSRRRRAPCIPRRHHRRDVETRYAGPDNKTLSRYAAVGELQAFGE